jgi:hypothetical protein
MAQGDGQTLDEAFKEAWKHVQDKQKVQGAKIQVWGSNPINGYRVILTPTPEGRPGG